MADLGQDAESLRIKVLEKEVQIEEKIFAKKRIELEQLKMRARLNEYDRSKVQIDEQVRNDQADLESLKAAHAAAAEASNG